MCRIDVKRQRSSGVWKLRRTRSSCRVNGTSRPAPPPLACQVAFAKVSSRNLNRDEKHYPDPETYNPARYLLPSYPTYLSPLTQHPNLRSGHGMHTFGWGRRTCLGQNLADTELFLAAGAVIWGFELGPKRDAWTGEEVAIDTLSTNSNVILEPKPWEMEILPREGRAGVILDGYKEVI